MRVQRLIEDLIDVCSELRSFVETKTRRCDKEYVVLRHIKNYANSGLKIRDFAKGLEWFNVSESLSLRRHLAGKIVILDFFTYCCINCMHILPDLCALEKKYSAQDGLVVVGVHSAKFENERDSSKLLSAVQRYNIEHPVVNDSRLFMWKDIGIVCWPSMVILGPAGEPLFVLIGEGHRDELLLYTKVALEYFKSLDEIVDTPIPLKLAQHILPMNKNSLLFPGKVHVYKDADDADERIVVSDTGNNRILIMKNDGNVLHVVGGYSPGFKDGSFEKARFNAPQGVCTLNNNVFVADNENHAIRKIDLSEKSVTTVAGIGVQGKDHTGGKNGKDQALSSPWDVAIYYHEQGTKSIPVLLIAIAGTHQIWALFLEDTKWWNNKSYTAGTCANIVGNGKEANRNNSYAHSSSLAQPSGLAVAQELKSVFFADSESSAVRRVCLDTGSVLPVCGADNDPIDLHCFGDADGKKYSAKLQHPLGVAWHPFQKMVYIADTYNHKIKKVDVEGNCVTVCGKETPSKNNVVSLLNNIKSLLKFKNTDDSPSTDVTFQFNEPSGLAVSLDGEILYVADTNHHCIKAIELSKIDNTRQISINLPAEAWNKGGHSYNFTCKVSPNEADLTITFCPSFENDLKLNPDAPQKWRLNLPSSDWKASNLTGDLSTPLAIKVPASLEKKQIHITLNIMACQSTKCIPKKLSIVYTIVRDDDAPCKVDEKRDLIVV